MQGGGLLYEKLSQYSALMVKKGLYGENGICTILQFQRDRYLSGRRIQVLGEEPLVTVGSASSTSPTVRARLPCTYSRIGQARGR